MTDRAVVDTNVLVVANGRATHVDEACRLSCVDELARLARNEVVCVDDKVLILREYERRTTEESSLQWARSRNSFATSTRSHPRLEASAKGW